MLREGPVLPEGEAAYATIVGDYLYVIGPKDGGIDGVIAIDADGNSEVVAVWEASD